MIINYKGGIKMKTKLTSQKFCMLCCCKFNKKLHPVVSITLKRGENEAFYFCSVGCLVSWLSRFAKITAKKNKKAKTLSIQLVTHITA